MESKSVTPVISVQWSHNKNQQVVVSIFGSFSGKKGIRPFQPRPFGSVYILLLVTFYPTPRPHSEHINASPLPALFSFSTRGREDRGEEKQSPRLHERRRIRGRIVGGGEAGADIINHLVCLSFLTLHPLRTQPAEGKPKYTRRWEREIKRVIRLISLFAMVSSGWMIPCWLNSMILCFFLKEEVGWMEPFVFSSTEGDDKILNRPLGCCSDGFFRRASSKQRLET